MWIKPNDVKWFNNLFKSTPTISYAIWIEKNMHVVGENQIGVSRMRNDFRAKKL